MAAMATMAERVAAAELRLAEAELRLAAARHRVAAAELREASLLDVGQAAEAVRPSLGVSPLREPVGPAGEAVDKSPGTQSSQSAESSDRSKRPLEAASLVPEHAAAAKRAKPSHHARKTSGSSVRQPQKSTRSPNCRDSRSSCLARRSNLSRQCTVEVTGNRW